MESFAFPYRPHSVFTTLGFLQFCMLLKCIEYIWTKNKNLAFMKRNYGHYITIHFGSPFSVSFLEKGLSGLSTWICCWHLSIQNKDFNFALQTSLGPCGLRVLYMPFGELQAGYHFLFYSRADSVWILRPDWWSGSSSS